MHALELSAITKLLQISPAAFQSPRSSSYCRCCRRRGTIKVSSSNQSGSSLSPQGGIRQHQHQSSAIPPPCKRTPLVDAVVQRGLQTHEAPFHVPGHKRGSTVPPSLQSILGTAMQYDLTELDGLDYLSYPEGPILEAQQLAAEAWGAGKTWFLVNGTTVGIHAAIMATCYSSSSSSSTDTLILARNAHQSAFNSAALAGCHVEYAMPSTACGLAHHVTPKSLKDAFQRAKTRGLNPKAALIVSPTYYGVVSDIEGLVEVCRHHGAVLIVDEAHGPHLHFLPALEENFDCDAEFNKVKSKSALDLGADVVIQSTHKLLGALTQGAMLHLRINSPVVDLPAKISRALSILQTSSPSYLIMASLDAARAQAQDRKALEEPHAAATAIHSWFLQNNLKMNKNIDSNRSSPAVTLSLLTTNHPVFISGEARMDPWRFTVLLEHIKNKNNVDNSDGGIVESAVKFTGWDAAAALESECGVVAELATTNSVVFAVGIGTTIQHAEALIKGLEWLQTSWRPRDKNGPQGEKTRKDKKVDEEGYSEAQDSSSVNNINNNDNDNDYINPDFLPEVVLTPREALFAALEVVPWSAAAGRISGELLCPYPPGVPAVCPGERIRQEVLDMLLDVVKKGGKVVGAADRSLNTVRVVDEK